MNGNKYLKTLDDSADVGQFASLGLTSTNKSMIAYYDATDANLKLATEGYNNFTVVTLKEVGNVGKFVSLTVDEKNNPHIVYYDEINTNLIYGNLDVNWAWKIIDGDESNTQNRGQFSSIKLNPTNDAPSASFFDVSEGGVVFVEGMVLY